MNKSRFLLFLLVLLISQILFTQTKTKDISKNAYNNSQIKVLESTFNLRNEKELDNWNKSCSAKWLENVNNFAKMEKHEFSKVAIMPESFLDIEPEGTFAIDKSFMTELETEISNMETLSYSETKKKIQDWFHFPSSPFFVPLAYIQISIGDEIIDFWNFAIVYRFVKFYFDCTKNESESIKQDDYFRFLKAKSFKGNLDLPEYRKEIKPGEIVIEYEKSSGALGIIHKREWKIYNESKTDFKKEEVTVRIIYLPIPKECRWHADQEFNAAYYLDMYAVDMDLYQTTISSKDKENKSK